MLTEIRSFLELCNVFLLFDPNFAMIAAPSDRRLQNNKPVKFDHLTKSEGKYFETLKSKLTEPPVLAVTSRKGLYTVDTTSCNQPVGCVMLEAEPEWIEKPNAIIVLDVKDS